MKEYYSNKDIVIGVPAGEYFLGDIAYAFTEEEWRKILKDNNSLLDVMGEFSGQKILAFSTGGDGIFYDSKGFKYSVDTGIIGLVPRSLINKEREDQFELKRLGRFVNFPTPIYCKQFSDSLLMFGDIYININQVEFEPEASEEGFWEIAEIK